MRQILADRAKASGRTNRWAGLERVSLTGLGDDGLSIDIMSLHHALEALEAARPRTAEVVRMRVFGGMELEEIVQALSISHSTVKREWRSGRAFVLSSLER